jgi:L-amino acid N-acyltransferase YncA
LGGIAPESIDSAKWIMLIRRVTESDLPGIVEIENREIAENFAHFGQSAGTLEQCKASFESAQGKYPWFVAVDGGRVIGFARCSPWKARESYQLTTEVGVYVRAELHGQGIGKKLYEALFSAMKDAGFKTILAGIAQPNPASNRLHEIFGMRYVGTLPDVGFKFGKWVSVGYWALHLSD